MSIVGIVTGASDTTRIDSLGNRTHTTCWHDKLVNDVVVEAEDPHTSSPGLGRGLCCVRVRVRPGSLRAASRSGGLVQPDGMAAVQVDAVRGYVAEVLGGELAAVTSVSRFEEGNRHAVYRVGHVAPAGEATEVVVRVSLSGDPDEVAQAEREARVLERLAGHGAPLLYDFRATSRWFDAPVMCMQLVAGAPRERGAAAPADVDRLGAVVARVHAVSTDGLDGEPGEAGTLVSYAEARLGSIGERRAWLRAPLAPTDQARLRRAASTLEDGWATWRGAECFPSSEGLALLHGDLAPGNVLWGAEPVLIDWEYTLVGDPADEIAYLFDQDGLSPAARDAFWTGYRAAASDLARIAHLEARVRWWEPVTILGSALWWVERFVRRREADAGGQPDPEVPRDPDYYLDHIHHRLERLERLLAPE
jgi:aminoglycoside phosphotransferase (APT) family kinase protein